MQRTTSHCSLQAPCCGFLISLYCERNWDNKNTWESCLWYNLNPVPKFFCASPIHPAGLQLFKQLPILLRTPLQYHDTCWRTTIPAFLLPLLHCVGPKISKFHSQGLQQCWNSTIYKCLISAKAKFTVMNNVLTIAERWVGKTFWIRSPQLCSIDSRPELTDNQDSIEAQVVQQNCYTVMGFNKIPLPLSSWTKPSTAPKSQRSYTLLSTDLGDKVVSAKPRE